MSRGITRARRDAAHPVPGSKRKRRDRSNPASGHLPAPHAPGRRTDDLARLGLRAAMASLTSRGELARLGLLAASRAALTERLLM